METEYEDTDGCRSTQIVLCGKVRKMILEKQCEYKKSKYYKPRITFLVSKILEKVADEYFKNKKAS